jgi:hypothetical protein
MHKCAYKTIVTNDDALTDEKCLLFKPSVPVVKDEYTVTDTLYDFTRNYKTNQAITELAAFIILNTMD